MSSAETKKEHEMPDRPSSQTGASRIPVSVITGFLGSGKTTLINNILHGQHGRRIAVIENEFGEVSIDSQLVETEGQEQLIEFNNGCLCCTVRGDLIRTLDSLTKRANLDAVLIETTGLADPAPVASTFFIADEIKSRFNVDAFITMVDACNIEHNLRNSQEAQEQIAFSDVILINKTDLVSVEDLNQVERRVRSLNPMAKIYHTEYGAIDLSHIIGIGAFDVVAKLEVDPTFLDDLAHEHDQTVGSFVIREDRPVDLNKFQIWLQSYLQKRGEDLFRTKGLFYAQGFPERIVFQSVRMLTSLRRERRWRSDETRRTEYVVIGRNIDREEFAAGFAGCVART
jgi:G3E family GTPase